MKKPAMLRGVADFLARPRKMWIDGQWISGATDEWIQSPDPATGKVIGHFANGSRADVEKAVEAARRAQPNWARRSGLERARAIRELFDKLGKHAEEFAQLITLDHGKIISESQKEFAVSMQFLERSGVWQHRPQACGPIDAYPGFLAASIHEAVGIVAVLTSSAYPLLYPLVQSVPALLAGNAVILKPAEKTSLVALRLAELFVETDIPPGAIQVVTGTSKSAGAALVGRPEVALISATGSEPAARALANVAASRLAASALHVARKSLAITFADADWAVALKAAFVGATFCQGQSDATLGRIYIEKQVFEKFVGQLASLLEAARPGHGLDPATRLGPLVSLDQQMRVLGHIETAQEAKAKVVSGGKAPTGNWADGFFIEPTLLVSADPKLPVFQEEVFGPVLEAISFQEISEIIAAEANRPAARQAGIWTADTSRAQQLALSLPVTAIWFNGFSGFGWLDQAPFGPDERTMAPAALTRAKTIYTRAP